MSLRRLIAALVLFLSVSPLFGAAPYGLTSRTPIGAFLNSKMPQGRPGAGAGEYYTTEAFPNLTFEDPCFLTFEPGTDRLFVCTRQGTIWHFTNNFDVSTKTLFLNLTNKTQGYEDCGLLGMAFHPEWRQPGSTNRGYVYVWYQYTTNRLFAPPGEDRPPSYYGTWMRLSRFTVPDGSNVADPSSEFVLINQFDRHFWHNGGGMFFGPDSFLYLTVGDEGGYDDEFNQAQRIDGGLFSGVLRIDVNCDPTKSHPVRRQPQSPAGSPPSYSAGYWIPNDNPWLNAGGTILEEFYAIGLRSPHRMTYDPVTAQIWVGDVGQGTREEVNLIVKGGNYQWSYLEGTAPGPKTKPASIIGIDVPPVVEYDHDTGNTCIIGGYVYRGSQLPGLYGKYLFADNTSGRIFSMTYNGTNAPTVVYLCNMPPGNDYTGISSFGIDRNNELYMCHMGPSGKIWKMEQAVSAGQTAPTLLSQTGAFSDTTNLVPTSGLIPYDVNSPLWSDAAIKRRWMAVPNNGAPYGNSERITFSPTGEWSFPAGTVFVKHFELATNESNPSLRKRLETRLLVRDTNNAVYGFTYKWRSNNQDADLVASGFNEDVVVTGPSGSRTQTWFYPGPNDCLTCHTPAANHVLGVKTRQLNGEYTYPSTGVTDNQLRALNNVALFNPTLTESSITNYARMVTVTNTLANLETRVRSYLDANCAHCHRPGGVQGNWDARFDTPLANQDIIDGPVNNTFGIANARVVAPGSLDRSLLFLRVNTNKSIKMPPVARNLVDSDASATIAAWINSLSPGALPSPWEHLDIGTVATSGNATYSATSGFHVTGSGSEIWANADEFQFAFVPVAGDCEVIARVTAVGDTSPWAKAGVMVRENLEPGARHVMNALTYQMGAMLQWRSTTDGGCSFSPGPGATVPFWLRLTRTGTVFRASHSLNGNSWTEYATTTVSMPSNAVAGLAVSAVNNGLLNSSIFDSVIVRPAGTAALDSDGDGMPDTYEIANYFNPYDASDALNDDDGDGVTNVQEFRAGTDPRSALSLLRISSLVRTNNSVVLRFDAASGRTYALERCLVLPPTNWVALTNLPMGTNTSLSFTNANATNGQGFFRLRSIQ